MKKTAHNDLIEEIRAAGRAKKRREEKRLAKRQKRAEARLTPRPAVKREFKKKGVLEALRGSSEKTER